MDNMAVKAQVFQMLVTNGIDPKVAIKVCTQCGQGIVIALDGLHQQVGVVVVSHLRAQRLDLTLYLSILQTIAVVAKPEAIATEHGEENKIQKRIVQPLVSTSKATVHHGCQGHRVIALVVRHCRISKRIITSVATDYFLYIVHNYLNVLSRSGNIPRYRKDGDKLLVSCL